VTLVVILGLTVSRLTLKMHFFNACLNANTPDLPGRKFVRLFPPLIFNALNSSS